MTGGDVPRVDLKQFRSMKDAIEKVAAANDYDGLVRRHLSKDGLNPVALPVVFFSSVVNRCNSLHLAIVREMEASNPHAVFLLIRAYSEAAALTTYVHDHVDYVRVLTGIGNRRPLKVGKLVAYAVRTNAPGFKNVHDELSDFTHFGTAAMSSPFVINDDNGGYTWTSYPRWKDDEQALIAAALTLEVAHALGILLDNFGNRYVVPDSG